MLTLKDFNSALESLELGNKPAIAHASLRSIGDIHGGAEAVLKALLGSYLIKKERILLSWRSWKD